MIKDDMKGGENSMAEIYTREEAAKYLRMSIPTLERKYKAGEISYIKSDRTVTFKKSFLDEYIRKHTVKASSDCVMSCDVS